MQKFEYKIVPAPEKVPRVKGLKGVALFAHGLEEIMNALGAEGWDYVRTDTLPQQERAGLTSKTTTNRNLLVFRRAVASHIAATALPLAETEADTSELAGPASDPTDENNTGDVENIWSDEHEAEGAPTRPLFPNRQREGMDL